MQFLIRYCLITVYLIVQVLASDTVFAQSSLTGKITNRQTGEPVPYASVFFAHTTLGTSSLEDGTFAIHKIPSGKYDLLVQMVGFQYHRQPVELEDGKYNIEIEMEPDNTMLDSINVMADQSDKKYFPVFHRFFVGDGKDAKDCKILNPEVLHFYFDRGKNYLTVTARKPVIISNPRLGYNVHYTIGTFGLHFPTGSKVMQGYPRFEEIPEASPKAIKSRDKRRRESYTGSLFHFMQALYSNELETRNFTLAIVDSLQTAKSSDSREILKPLELKDHLTGEKVKQFRFKGLLKLEYQKDENIDYPGRGHSRWTGNNPKGHQQTYIQLKNDFITLYENGYFSEQKSVYLTGYMVWKETVCNMVPIGLAVGKAK